MKLLKKKKKKNKSGHGMYMRLYQFGLYSGSTVTNNNILHRLLDLLGVSFICVILLYGCA